MTYLELCKRLVREAGLQGDGPATVTGQTGLYLLVTEWIATSYQQIQALRQDWGWMWQRVEISTVVGQADYDLGDASVSDLRHPTLYDTGEGEAAEGPLAVLTYADWLARYGAGTQANGRPAYATLLPSRKLRLTPAPDATTYRVQADARRLYHSLAANTDTPLLPAEHHLMVVWHAMAVHCGPWQAAPEVVQRGELLFNQHLKALEREWLPTVRGGEPIA